MARTLCCVAVCVLVAALVAGCGGGGGSKLSGAYGTITGSVSELPLSQGIRAPSSPIVLTVDGTNLSTQAGSDGSFILEHVPVGMHTLVAHTNSRACAVVVSVEEGRETSVGEMVLTEAGQISGLVTDASTHAPIAYAVVAVTEMVYNTDGQMPHPVRVCHTDANGSYMVSALPAGEYLVTISKDGYVTCSLDLTVTAGATTPGDAALQAGAPAGTGTLTGTAYLQTDSGEPQPVPGVLVRLVPSGHPVDVDPLPDWAIGGDGNPVDLYPDDGVAPPPVPFSKLDGPPMPPYFDYYTYTDENGAYKMTDLPAGQYTAVAVRPGLQIEQQTVTIAANQTTTLNFTMHLVVITYGAIEGTVTDVVTHSPIQGAYVRAVYGIEPMPLSRQDSGGAVVVPDPSICVMYTRTDEKGHYALKVPERVNSVLFAAQGYEIKTEEVQVVPNGSVTLDAALTPLAGQQEFTLSGRVMIKQSADGEAVPCAGATVLALPAGPQPMDGLNPVIWPPVNFSTTSNDNGDYSIVLPAGEYIILATKNDRQSEPVTIQLNENKTQNILIPYSDGGVMPPPPPPM